MSTDETSSFYQTEAWQIKIDQTLDSFEVPQPEELQQLTQTQEKSSVQGQYHLSNSLYNASYSFHLNFHSILFTEEMVQMHVHSLLYCW